MSVLTSLWRHLTKGSRNTQKKGRVAILTVKPSETMSHYIDRLSAYLELLSPYPTEVMVYDQFGQTSMTRQLLNDHARRPINGVIAMDCDATQAFVRLKTRVGLEMPGIVIGYPELLPKQLPADIIAISSPDLSGLYFQLFQRIYPQATRFLLAGRRQTIEKTKMQQNLLKLSAEAGIAVDLIYLDETGESLEEQFAQHAPGATFTYLAFDTEVFRQMADLVKLSHQYGLLAFASNIHAIHYNADLIFGYPETKVFRHIAGRLLMVLHGGLVASEPISFNLQLHCNAHNLRNGYQYVLDNISSLLLESDVSVHLHANDKAQR